MWEVPWGPVAQQGELSVHPQNPRLLALPWAPHRSVGCLHSPALPRCSGHILGIFIWHHHTPVGQANNHQLSYFLLSSLALCFLCPFMFIGHPEPLTCAIHQAAFGVTFTICVSTVLAKTIVVVAAFHATRSHTWIRKWVGPVLPRTIAMACSLVQATLCTLWVTRCPPQPCELYRAWVHSDCKVWWGLFRTVLCRAGLLGFAKSG